MSTLSLRVRELREKRGMSQAELGKAAGVRQATVSDIENGRVTGVKLGTLEKLARALDVPAQRLIVTRGRVSPS